MKVRHKNGGLIILVDCFKTFDVISWAFVDTALEMFGFNWGRHQTMGAHFAQGVNFIYITKLV